MAKTTREERIEQIEKELVELREIYQAKKTTWEQGRQSTERVKALKEEIKQLEHHADIAEKQTDYDKVAQIRYGELPRLHKELESLELEESDSSADIVDTEDIATIVAKWTGVPVSKLVASEIEKLGDLEGYLQERVIGQENAVHLVANAIRRARVGLKDPKRPIGSFLFLGPTGVGKTELSKALASFLFNDEKALTRIDMSEYMEKHSVARLIGSPPGYVGHEEGGQLTEAVRRKPYAVLLFDEIEKAHPDVFNILLQVLDEGRLTDSKGKTVDFKNTIIILTSNIGSDLILERMQFHGEREKEAIISELEKKSKRAPRIKKEEIPQTPLVSLDEMMPLLLQRFRPEFLNRLDDIVIFNPLSQAGIRSIVDIQIQQYLDDLSESRDISLNISDDTKDFLAEKGWDPHFGARPLKRAIQSYLLDELALAIIDGKIVNGSQVEVTREGEKLHFSV